MPFKRAHAGILATVLVAAGAGFMLARAFDPHSGAESATTEPAGEEHGEHAEAEGEHVEGFVALAPGDAPASGVALATVERGGGIDLLLPGRVTLAVDARRC